MVAAVSKKQKFTGAGVYRPSSGNSNLAEPNGAGITNTIGTLELAAIAAAISHNHTCITTTALPHSIKIGNNCCTQRSTVTMSKETSSKFFLVLLGMGK